MVSGALFPRSPPVGEKAGYTSGQQRKTGGLQHSHGAGLEGSATWRRRSSNALKIVAAARAFQRCPG
jgi:hypothetical protein